MTRPLPGNHPKVTLRLRRVLPILQKLRDKDHAHAGIREARRLSLPRCSFKDHELDNEFQPGPPPDTSWIEPLIGKEDVPPKLVFLSGWWGRSSEPGYLRFYTTPSLQDYFDVPRAAIIGHLPAPAGRAPLEAVHVWIEAEARLIFGPADGTRLIATYAVGRAWCREQGLVIDVQISSGGLLYEVSTPITDDDHCIR